MQDTSKYTQLFAEKLKETDDMQQAIVKAVWIAYLDGIADSLSNEFKQQLIEGVSASLRPGDTFNLTIKIGQGDLFKTNWVDEEVTVKLLTDPNDWDETRIDVIGANGNEGLHYVE